jgi:hypothetical protein
MAVARTADAGIGGIVALGMRLDADPPNPTSSLVHFGIDAVPRYFPGTGFYRGLICSGASLVLMKYPD